MVHQENFMNQNRKRHTGAAERGAAAQGEVQSAAPQVSAVPAAIVMDATALEKLDRLEKLLRSMVRDSLESIQGQREMKTALQNATTSFSDLDMTLKNMAQTVWRASQDSQKSVQLAEDHFAVAIRELEARLRDEMQWQIYRSALMAVFPALDDLDLIIAHHKNQAGEAGIEGSVLEALLMVRQKFNDGFCKLGLEEIPVELGVTAFDPTLHEAVPLDVNIDVAKDSAAPRGTILFLRRAGYRLNGKLFRSPQVIVKQ